MIKKQQLNSEIEAAEFGMLADEYESEASEAGANNADADVTDPTAISAEEAAYQESLAKEKCDRCHQLQSECVCEDYLGQHITGAEPASGTK